MSVAVGDVMSEFKCSVLKHLTDDAVSDVNYSILVDKSAVFTIGDVVEETTMHYWKLDDKAFEYAKAFVNKVYESTDDIYDEEVIDLAVKDTYILLAAGYGVTFDNYVLNENTITAKQLIEYLPTIL